jgi:tubulin monoglycylase TTLL3/8
LNQEVTRKYYKIQFPKSDSNKHTNAKHAVKKPNVNPLIEPEVNQQELSLFENQILHTLNDLKKKYPQTNMNGCENLWILKPINSSRGRGINLKKGLGAIINHLKTYNTAWVIQKYMENPLTYKNRKMDIRQWCLVLDFQPLEIWFFNKCYIRISTDEYDLADYSNKYKHLTNNSVNKHSENFVVEDGFLSQADFKTYLEASYGPESFKKIQDQMKEQIKISMLAGEDSIDIRTGSNTIYGFDFCVDD